MTDFLHEIVDTIMAEEARRAMAAVPVPVAPDVRPCEPELAPIPAIRSAVENVVVPVVALLALAAGFTFA